MRAVPIAIVLLLAGATTLVAGARALTPNCATDDLRVTASLQGEAGHVVGGIALKNVGSRTCLLPRWPVVAILWHGRALSLKALPWESYPANAEQHEILLLKPRARAFMPLLWSNWCGPRPWGKLFLSPAIQLSIWDARVTVTPQPQRVAPPLCLSPKQPSTLLFGRFYTPLPIGWPR